MQSQQRIAEQVARGTRLRLVQRRAGPRQLLANCRPSFFSDASEKRRLSMSIRADARPCQEHSYGYHQYSRKSYYHATPFYTQRSTGSVMAPHGLQEVQVASDNVMDRNSMDGINISGSSSGSTSTGSDQVMDEHVERFAAQCMSQLLPRYHDYSQVRNTNNAREMSSLDLELGEDDYHDPWELDQAAQEAAQEEELIDQEEAGYEDDDIASAMDELVNDNDTNTNNPTQFAFQKRKASGLDLLLEFDPENPPPSDDPEALQLWLECDAQQEAVFKYQKVIDSARDRKDYSSLSMVQRQVLRWFQPLKEEIATRQKNYIMKEGASNATAAKRYGPYLCALPPEKLAVIVAHEAIMHALLKSGVEGRGGVPFVSMAKRIGEAVEEEVLIHRLLHKRFLAGQLRMREDEDTEMFDQSGDTAEEGPAIVKEGLVSDRPTTQVGDRNSTIGELTKELDPVASTHKWAYAPSHLRNYMEEISQYEPNAKKRRVVSYAIRRARQILEKEEEWSVQEKVQLGAALFQALLDKATIVQDGKEEMAFTYEKRWFQKNKIRSYVSLNEGLYKMVVSDKLHSFGATTTKHKPMILPPKPWTDPNDGGYLWLKVDLIRYHGCNTQKEALQNADLSTVFDGLNALGRVPWQINKRILEVANHCWENSIALGDIPARTDFEVPPEPIQPERPAIKLEKDHPGYKESVAEYRAYREALSKCRRLQQKNMDLRSLRCSAMLKLDQAEKFQNFEQIYFPYNMDFRGRAYPVPPHLSNVGSDLCRGMLKFAEAKPLGPRGLYWLKVHLANFAGKDKMSFDERAKFVDEHIDEIRASAADPFAGDMWWMTLEDPFQGLATCIEIVNALDSGDPESFMCSLPVHMDGSCNGLQHYAALGRDLVGGKAVNLCSMEEPQDVYVGVMHEVIKRVSEEAERKLDFDVSDIDSLSRKQKKEYKDNRAAQLVNGLIDRGVVKRTVMTSVYGVTYIGARQQIQEKIESKLEAQGQDIDEISSDIFNACGYLARVTMDVMGDLFTGAKDTMNWLTTCAKMISQHGFPVAWISPIGIPAIQPYRQKRSATLVTLLQTVTLVDESDDLPIHKQRQCSAFPPNYIHSLDSSHMLLTALEMDRRGLSFSAVHDSFWTHPCNIDEMNGALRDVFVDLYDQPLLERLLETWQMRYPDLDFPELPKRGELDLQGVKTAPYFFQ